MRSERTGERLAARSRDMWHCIQRGSGPPLVLLHGIGMSHAAWNPVLPHLVAHRTVIAFDIAGFGATPALPGDRTPTIAHLVDALERSLRRMGLNAPVDMAGNSLGATLALEAARRGSARRVVAIAPACLWRRTPPVHVKHVFRACRLMATRGRCLVTAALRIPAVRELLLAVPLSIGSGRMTHEDAARTIADLANATAFDATFESTAAPFSAGSIAVPVTVVFGSRDFILTRSARWRSALPGEVHWRTQDGWGHVPMWVDPAGVADIILSGIAVQTLPRAGHACRRHVQ